MNKRDYLRSIGFHVGERGRLTPAMLEALKDFKDDSPIKPISVEMVIDEPVYVEMRDPLLRPARVLYGYTREGYKVGFTTCSSCNQHMTVCSCKNGITAPVGVISTKEKDVFINR